MDHSTQQLIDKFKRNPAIAQSLLQSGDGQRLMQMLTSQDGGAALNHAAQNAAAGNTKEPLSPFLALQTCAAYQSYISVGVLKLKMLRPAVVGHGLSTSMNEKPLCSIALTMMCWSCTGLVTLALA